MMNSSLRKTSYAALVCSIAVFATSPVQAYESPLHVFSINDVQGDFHGTTYAEDPSIICGVPHVDAEGVITDPYPCEFPAPLPIFDKEGIKLYPVDSEFGFYVVDFLGARQKIREPDNPAYIADYREGWVGNIEYQGQVVGVKVSNAETDKYKVKPPLGTWCQGLGGTSIKCSTEHYVAMEHVLSCHEIIPYMLANPLTGIQAELNFPPPYLDKFDCTKAELDDALRIIREGEITDDLLTSVEPGSDIPANDNTTVMDDIAVSTDYSVTLKDDGKPLYRWGAMIKRPNDIRLYAKLQLPQAWKAKEETEEGSGIWVYPKYKVTQAHLIVNHWVTNNPNDQLRPEDLENEAATGRKPDYEIVDGSWKSTRDCYEGDGDFLDTSEMDPTYLPAGTFLKNATYAGNPAGLNPPLVFSSDQVNGFTNAYYTSTNRDPFEWSYRLPGTPDNVYNFVGFPFPLTADEVFLSGLEPVSGPRWRLKSNKFGQNICGLEIPAQECSPPPFQHDNIKYEVGEMVTTVINLLDWEDKTESPLAFSDG